MNTPTNTLRNEEEKLNELIFLKLGLDLTRKDTQYPLVPAKDLAKFKSETLKLLSQAVNKARLEEMKRIKETWGEAVDKTLSQVPFKFVSLNDINKRIRELESPNQEEEKYD